MSIVSIREELERFNSIPLLCVRCGFQITIPQPGAETLDALYAVSSLRESEHELSLLLRAKALFDSFPNSRHPQKMCKEFLRKADRPKMEPDAELDKALDSDPELKAFLFRSSFWLLPRMESVEEFIKRHEQPELHLIACTNCVNGHFCIESEFFENIL